MTDWKEEFNKLFEVARHAETEDVTDTDVALVVAQAAKPCTYEHACLWPAEDDMSMFFKRCESCRSRIAITMKYNKAGLRRGE